MRSFGLCYAAPWPLRAMCSRLAGVMPASARGRSLPRTMPDPDPMRAHLSTPAMPAATARRTRPSRAVPLLLFAAATLPYAANLGHLPHPAELYQIIPAESLLATGKPRIADGLYTRALAQTWIIAGSFRLFGHSLAVARLSSAV